MAGIQVAGTDTSKSICTVLPQAVTLKAVQETTAAGSATLPLKEQCAAIRSTRVCFLADCTEHSLCQRLDRALRSGHHLQQMDFGSLRFQLPNHPYNVAHGLFQRSGLRPGTFLLFGCDP